MRSPHPNDSFDNKAAEPKPNDGSLCKKEKEGKPWDARAITAQVLATLGFSLLLIAIGLVISMPTIVIGGLLHNKNESFSLDDYDASWFGSIIFISQPFGSVTSGFFQDKFGRKRCMMVVNIPLVIGWTLIYYSTSVTTLYIASIILGLSLGFMEAPVLSYVGETTQPHLRSTLSSLSGSFGGIGMMLECLIGALTDWRSTCAISAIVPVLAIISISMIPESPSWLIIQGRTTEAEQALCWLRGWVHPMYVRDEFLELLEYTKSSHNIKEMINISPSIETKKTNDNDKVDNEPVKKIGVMDTIALLKEPKLYRPLRMVLVIFFVSHCSSLLGMRPFMVSIFDLIGMPLGSHWVLVVSGILQIIGSFIGMVFMILLGKRNVNFISLFVCIFSCYALGILIMMNNVVPWIKFGLFCILFFAAGFGIVPLPWILISEIFPLEGRGMAGGLSAAASYLLAFVVTKTYINLSQWFDIHGALFIYGTIALVGLIHLYYCLPETEGKTLAEIETYFKDRDKVKPSETTNGPPQEA